MRLSLGVSHMKEEYILFVEKAHKLEASPFWKWFTNKHGPADMTRIINGDWLAHNGLNAEVFEAFCLTLRLLIQDGDGFSVREIAESAKAWPTEFESQARGIEDARRELNTRLDEECTVRLSSDEKTTNRELFDVIFYGGIVHSNPRKRNRYDKFVSSGLFSFFAFYSFCGALAHYRNCIQSVAFHLTGYMNEKERLTKH